MIMIIRANDSLFYCYVPPCARADCLKSEDEE